MSEIRVYRLAAVPATAQIRVYRLSTTNTVSVTGTLSLSLSTAGTAINVPIFTRTGSLGFSLQISGTSGLVAVGEVSGTLGMILAVSGQSIMIPPAVTGSTSLVLKLSGTSLVPSTAAAIRIYRTSVGPPVTASVRVYRFSAAPITTTSRVRIYRTSITGTPLEPPSIRIYTGYVYAQPTLPRAPVYFLKDKAWTPGTVRMRSGNAWV